jgi:hypothetical protein
MKLLSALFTALVVVGFAGAASAQCAGYNTQAQQSAEAPIVLPEGSAGS